MSANPPKVAKMIGAALRDVRSHTIIDVNSTALTAYSSVRPAAFTIAGHFCARQQCFQP